ncbi:DUF2892 domain-containing protein [Roseisolibacter sp. H3M3-2]|nr:DUF2892 domain-containing protein [Roseisolibacter sp. H3M3-2]
MVRMADGAAALDEDAATWGEAGRRARRARSHADPQKEHGRHGATAHESRGEGRNVNAVERALSLAAGAWLASMALKRKDWSALALGVAGGALLERGVSGHCPVYGALGVTTARDERPTRLHGAAATVDAKKAQRIERAMTIHGRGADELYLFWRRLENLPRIFQHLESVTEHDARRSRWVAKAPAGRTVEWEAEIVNEVPGEVIAWKSLPGSQVPNAGSVNFRELPAGRGVEIRVVLEYEPPAGKLGVAVARLFGEEPAIQVREDLRRYKALVEAGELPVSEIPGQGERARVAEFNAQVSRGDTGADLGGFQERAPGEAHEPTHVPTPADAERGINTSEPATWEART